MFDSSFATSAVWVVLQPCGHRVPGLQLGNHQPRVGGAACSACGARWETATTVGAVSDEDTVPPTQRRATR